MSPTRERLSAQTSGSLRINQIFVPGQAELPEFVVQSGAGTVASIQIF